MIELVQNGLKFPEGPAFDAYGGLWCVEIERGCITCLTADPIIRIHTDGKPNGLAFNSSGQLWVCDQIRGLLRINIDTLELVVVASQVDDIPLDKPNDLAFDHLGNLVFTCPADSRQTPTGKVWVRRPSGDITCVSDTHYFPNGLVFLNEDRSLVIAETYKQRLLRGKWDPQTCVWSDIHSWVETRGPIGPDGLTVGPDGFVFAAIFDGSAIQVISPEGIIVQTIDTPGKRPTNLVFSPKDPNTLYFTEAETGCCYKTLWESQTLY
jgi:gluconolactonase